MTLKWTISHEERLVTVTAEGFIPVEELEDYYDALVVSNALSYSRLFDARLLDDKHATDEEFMRLGARMRAYTAADFKFGPLAYVVTSPAVRELVNRTLNLAPADRPVKMFSTVERAKRWLEQQRIALAPL
jgi:hypothetical protein